MGEFEDTDGHTGKFNPVEQKVAEEMIAEDKRIAEEKKAKKIAEDKRIADEKIAEDKRIADEKIAEDADEKIAEDKRIAEKAKTALRNKNKREVFRKRRNRKRRRRRDNNVTYTQNSTKGVQSRRGGTPGVPIVFDVDPLKRSELHTRL